MSEAITKVIYLSLIHISFDEKKGIIGYVYQNTTMETVPLYEYFSDELNDQ